MGFSIWDNIPVGGQHRHRYGAGKDADNGDWKGAGSEGIDALSPTINEARNFQSGYDDKKAGYQAVQDATDRIKKERLAEKNFAFNKADAEFDPTKKALAALYGDPSQWKL